MAWSSVLGMVEFFEPHRPIGKVSLRLIILDENDDPAMTWISFDLFHRGHDGLFRALQELHKIAVFVQQHSRDPGGLIIASAFLE